MGKAGLDDGIPVFWINLGSIGQSSVRRFGAKVEVKGECRAEGPTLNMVRGPAPKGLIGHMDSSESPHTVPNQFMKVLKFLKHSETSSCQDL